MFIWILYQQAYGTQILIQTYEHHLINRIINDVINYVDHIFSNIIL